MGREGRPDGGAAEVGDFEGDGGGGYFHSSDGCGGCGEGEEEEEECVGECGVERRVVSPWR